jgi:hypothetical protein
VIRQVSNVTKGDDVSCGWYSDFKSDVSYHRVMTLLVRFVVELVDSKEGSEPYR